MPDQPYKQIEVASNGGGAIATFTRDRREDQCIRIEIRNGLSVRMEPTLLATIAELLSDDLIQLS